MLDGKNLSLQRKKLCLSFPNIHVGRNDRLLLLGPSGSGKTTLLSILAGLLPPSSGTVIFENQDFYKMPPRERDRMRGRQLGFVFQTLHLIPSLTLRQNITLAADMAKILPDSDRLENLLHSLGLTEKGHQKPEALSQGEQQRSAIARAVFNRPEILIADEPTSALDDENAQKVMELLTAQAAENGASLLVATHDARITKYFDKTVRLVNNSTREPA